MNRASTHENFRYWIQFLDKMQIVYDMIRADREGNWLLHLDAIQRSLHEFGAWDGVNYFRWASVYLEEMQLLPKLSPIVYENFLKGKPFSIKTTGGRFNAVGGDQKLEQTINLASKRSDTFISNSKNKSFLGKWNLIYHEMLSVKQICAEYTDIIDSSFEGWQHNEASSTYTRKMEDQIQNMIHYIENKGSPFTSSCPTILQNFVTKQQMTHDIRNDLLNASQKGKAKYLEFRKEVFIEKARRFSATIHRSNLKSMKNILLSDSHSKKASCIAKTVSTNDRKIEIARERGLTTDDLLKYDVVHSPLLYDNGFMTKPNKSQLVIELEKNLSSQDYSYSNQLDSATTVDVMANIRRLPVKDVSTFSWFAKKFFSSIQKYMSIGRCNFVFDIYDDRPSAKDCERMRRQNVHPINLSEIDDNTPIPKDISTFWPSKSNKMLLEKYLYNTLCKKESPYPIVIGQVAHDEDRWKCVIQHELLVRPHMISQPYLEEADSQIVLYVILFYKIWSPYQCCHFE